MSRNRTLEPEHPRASPPVHRAGQGQGPRHRAVGFSLNGAPQTIALGQQAHVGDPSLDLYYRVTPSLSASLTFNTDFSATEVDDRQVNLTRFNLFFPEKRDFFLNDADLFEFGRIGARGLRGGQRS